MFARLRRGSLGREWSEKVGSSPIAWALATRAASKAARSASSSYKISSAHRTSESASVMRLRSPPGSSPVGPWVRGGPPP